jgi:hypothetical protein
LPYAPAVVLVRRVPLVVLVVPRDAVVVPPRAVVRARESGFVVVPPPG